MKLGIGLGDALDLNKEKSEEKGYCTIKVTCFSAFYRIFTKCKRRWWMFKQIEKSRRWSTLGSYRCKAQMAMSGSRSVSKSNRPCTLMPAVCRYWSIFLNIRPPISNKVHHHQVSWKNSHSNEHRKVQSRDNDKVTHARTHTHTHMLRVPPFLGIPRIT